jgi:hypothetical protein
MTFSSSISPRSSSLRSLVVSQACSNSRSTALSNSPAGRPPPPQTPSPLATVVSFHPSESTGDMGVEGEGSELGVL